MDNTKIPKIIHYCWFGNNPKNEIINMCIESWRRFLPDYEIIEWNESNYDINSNSFTKQAYDNKKWAFVSDFVRLKALYEYGGVYLDTDTEITSNIDEFLNNESFIAFESDNIVACGILGSSKNNAFVKRLMQYYENKKFVKDNGELDTKAIPRIITDILVEEYDLNPNNTSQVIGDGIHVYPKENFYMIDSKYNNYSVHHYNGSWQNLFELRKDYLKYKKNYIIFSELACYLLGYSEDNKKALETLTIYNKVVIYGFGNIGKLLVDYFKKNNINTNCIINNVSGLKSYCEIPIFDLDYLKQLSKEDLIIITPSYDFYDIYKKLKSMSNASIMSIEELLNKRVIY